MGTPSKAATPGRAWAASPRLPRDEPPAHFNFLTRIGLLPSDLTDVPSPRLKRRSKSEEKLAAMNRKLKYTASAPRLSDLGQSRARSVEDDFEPPESFALLAIVFEYVWSLSTHAWRHYRQAGSVPPAHLRIDHARHVYPNCLVWTPIHPITWICPYVGHVGLCGPDGVVLDFAGKRIGRGSMAFGWPARYVQLLPEATPDWSGEIERASEQFGRVDYNFLTWNCHSFLAGFLNNIGHTPDRMAERLGCWTVAGVGLRLFVDGRYVGHGGLQQWGGSVAVSGATLWAGLCYGSWGYAAVWGHVLLLCNSFFVFWFGLLAVCRAESQRGIVPEDMEQDSDSDDDMCRTGL